jgi:hypothetical protein
MTLTASIHSHFLFTLGRPDDYDSSDDMAELLGGMIDPAGVTEAAERFSGHGLAWPWDSTGTSCHLDSFGLCELAALAIRPSRLTTAIQEANAGSYTKALFRFLLSVGTVLLLP